MAVFINITSDKPWLVANETVGGWQSQKSIDHFLHVGNQTAEVSGVQVNLPDLKAAYDYLRWVPAGWVLSTPVHAAVPQWASCMALLALLACPAPCLHALCGAGCEPWPPACLQRHAAG